MVIAVDKARKIICSECKDFHTCEVKYDVTDIYDVKPVFVPSLACPVLRPDLDENSRRQITKRRQTQPEA